MHNIANYDVTAACGYVGCPLNGFNNPLAPLRHVTSYHCNVHLLCYSGHIGYSSSTCSVNLGNCLANSGLPGYCDRITKNSYRKLC